MSIERLISKARRRLLTMHWASGVGHVGGNLSCIDALVVLHHQVMGPNDAFVLSKGHSAGALYVALWSVGLLCDADLDSFHGEGTLLAGHPPAAGIDGVLFGTGSLGHGLSLAAGLALAARLAGNARRVFCLTSDAEWQEGSTWEALIFAAHHRLDKLTIMIDANGLQGFGRTADIASMDPIAERLRGFGVSPVEVDGHDPAAMASALSAPSIGSPPLLVLRTVKGKGVPGFEGLMESHYLPLSEDAYRQALDQIAD